MSYLNFSTATSQPAANTNSLSQSSQAAYLYNGHINTGSTSPPPPPPLPPSATSQPNIVSVNSSVATSKLSSLSHKNSTDVSGSVDISTAGDHSKFSFSQSQLSAYHNHFDDSVRDQYGAAIVTHDRSSGSMVQIATSAPGIGPTADASEVQSSTIHLGQFFNPLGPQTMRVTSGGGFVPNFSRPVGQNPVYHMALPFSGPSISNRRRGRQTYSRHQTCELENEFQHNNYLTRKRRVDLSRQLALSERQIKIWFQNRRMKLKKERFQGRQGTTAQRGADGSTTGEDNSATTPAGTTPSKESISNDGCVHQSSTNKIKLERDVLANQFVERKHAGAVRQRVGNTFDSAPYESQQYNPKTTDAFIKMMNSTQYNTPPPVFHSPTTTIGCVWPPHIQSTSGYLYQQVGTPMPPVLLNRLTNSSASDELPVGESVVNQYNNHSYQSLPIHDLSTSTASSYFYPNPYNWAYGQHKDAV